MVGLFSRCQAANTHLVQTVEQLQKQNMMLVGRNQELESSFKRVAQLAAERDRERRQYVPVL